MDPSDKTLKLGVAMVVQNDEETIIPCLESFYDYVDCIHVSNDPMRGFNGKAICPDSTIELIREFDRLGKITITTGNFFNLLKTPIENDTGQRELTTAFLKATHPGLDWVLHVDADEVFTDFSRVIHSLQRMPREVQSVFWNWVPVFKKLGNGDLLVVCGQDGLPAFEVFPLAHRPHVRLEGCRYPNLFPRLKGHQWLRLPLKHRAIRHEGRSLEAATLHYTFAKSEKKILEKLSTWTHAGDFNVEEFYQLWLNAEYNWQFIKDFHPLTPTTWPRLKKFSANELQNLEK